MLLTAMLMKFKLAVGMMMMLMWFLADCFIDAGRPIT